MASSSSTSRSWRYDVFPSFSGEDVRRSFLSHLLEKLNRKLIITFIDHGIERSRPIAPELLSAIRESRIAIVVFSKKYASSTWCLNELVEIHNCFKDFDQMVIPIFYDVDPSDVRKQTGEFGEGFEKTCNGKTEEERQRWIRALSEVANLAGEDSRNWSDEANMIENIAKDVSNKLMTPSNDFGDFVGIEDHLERLNSILGLESEEVRMLGIVGASGIGKSTIGRALFSKLSSRFHHRAFVSYKRTQRDDYGMKLCWEEQFLSEILCQKDIKMSHLGVVEQKLKGKQVLIIVDDVDDLELLKTLVEQTRWVGSGSRIVVITQDRKLLKSHNIDPIYEVELPSEDLALQMFCRSAFGQNSPPYGFMELAVEVAELSGNLPLGLSVLGSSLRGMDKEDWVEMLPRLRNSLDGKIEKTLKVSYDGLDGKDQDVFLSIACLFIGHKVSDLENLLGDSAKSGLKILADKSLIRITPSEKTVQMHCLLQKLGKEIVRAESINNPGKRRFLVDAEDICDVLTDNTGTENVLGIYFNTSEINEPLFIDENSFEGMRNLKFLKFYKEWSRETGEGRLVLPRDLVRFPRKLRLLHWNEYPSACMPCNFRGEYLVKIKMMDSKLERLWEGTQLLRSLKKMDMRWSADLKVIPDLSKATNLEKLNLRGCTSLVTLPSSIRNLNKLRVLSMKGCSKLKGLPADVNLESLESLDLRGCSKLRTFPRISRNISELLLNENAIEGEEDCFWIQNIFHLIKLDWDGLPMRYMPSNFCPEYLTELHMRGSRLEKLWGGVKSLGSLVKMVLSGCESLKEIPDLSTATNLECMELNNCKNLVILPSSIRDLKFLRILNMKGCTALEVLPTDVNLVFLENLNLRGCSKLRNFPQISTSIKYLFLDDTAIVEVPSMIERMGDLQKLTMSGCKQLKNVSPNILKLVRLEADFSDCGGITAMCDQLPGSYKASFALPFSTSIQFAFSSPNLRMLSPTPLRFNNCFNLDRDAQELILQSYFFCAIFPGGEVPMYFTHRACGTSVIIPLSESSLSQENLGFKACIVVGPPTHPEDRSADIGVRWCFRGRKGVIPFGNEVASCNKDHLVILFFVFPGEEVYESPSELSNNVLQLEFYYHSYACSCGNFGSDRHTKTCPLLPQRIKGCGVRVVNMKTLYYYQKSGVSDEEWGIIKSRMQVKRMQMTNATSEEPSNSLYVQTAVKWGCMTYVKSNNCFNLDRDAPELILESQFYRADLTGGEVPMYFTHRACGSSLIIPLSESLFSQENLIFKACIVIGPPTHPEDNSADFGVSWCFRGKKGVIPFCNEAASSNMDILVIRFFVFPFPEEEVDESPSELNNNVLQLEFYYHSHVCSCTNFGPHRKTKPCPFLPQRIKGCGVRFVNISQSGSPFIWHGRLEEAMYDQESGESDEESDRSKKRMRMTVTTSEESSNSQTAVNSELVASNLELSLGVVGASALVSSRSKVPSPSSSFHVDDGASLSLSLSPFDPSLGGDSLYVDPMIIQQQDTGTPSETASLYFDPMIVEQQDTETPSEDSSLSPQLLNYFR